MDTEKGKRGVNLCRNEGKASSEGLAVAAAKRKAASLRWLFQPLKILQTERAVNEGLDVDDRKKRELRRAKLSSCIYFRRSTAH